MKIVATLVSGQLKLIKEMDEVSTLTLVAKYTLATTTMAEKHLLESTSESTGMVSFKWVREQKMQMDSGITKG